MKTNIHPKVYTNATVTCACGNTFATVSTKENLSVEICSMCHPLYTGKQRFIDTEGQIQKFAKKMQFAKENQKAPKKEAKASTDKKPLTLKELREMQTQE